MKNKCKVILFFLIFFLNVSFVKSEIPKCVVYYDESYATWWVSRKIASEIKDELTEQGFVSLSAKSLAEWMENVIKEKKEDTVVVFSQDVIPDTLAETPSKDCLLRKYLDTGGKVIWLGEVPLYYQAQKDKVNLWGSEGGFKILGFYSSYASLDKPVKVEITKEGKNIGLNNSWEGKRPVRKNDVDKVFATNGNLASSWLKNFCKQKPDSGFLRIWDCGMSNVSYGMLSDLSFIASSGGNSSLEKVSGKIFLPEESDFYSVYHFYKDKLKREIRIICLNPKREDLNYELHIKKGDSLLEKIELGKSNESSFKENKEVPLLFKNERIELYANSKEEKKLISKIDLNEKEVFYKLDFYSNIDPISNSRFLIPKSKIVINPNSNLNIKGKIVYLGEGRINALILLKISGITIEEKEISLDEGKIFILNWTTEKMKLSQGKYNLSLDIKYNKDILSEERNLIVVLPKKVKKDFGAYYANLTYDNPVYIYKGENKFDKKSWEEIWKSTNFNDVIVNLPNNNKYLFWRGLNYIPVWVFGNVGLTYEWVEAQGGWGERAKYVNDCVEPLQDKECRYSRVNIVSSNTARCVVHWRYAECDLDYKIIDDEWIDEYYTFYPDGFGTRTVYAWIKSKNWHEINEFIVVLPAGVNPYEVIENRAVTILEPSGKKTELCYPDAKISFNLGNPAIFRIHLKDNKKTAIEVTNAFLSYEALYNGWKVNRRFISPSYWGHHWPITRGHPTCQGPPNLWKECPTHASLLSPKHKEIFSKLISKDNECVIYSFLIGSTEISDKELLKVANSWLYPAEIKIISGAKTSGYDQKERAYLIDVKAKKIELELNPKKEMVNPIFLINNLTSSKLKVFVNGKELSSNQFKFSLEENFSEKKGVLFLDLEIKGKTRILISS